MTDTEQFKDVVRYLNTAAAIVESAGFHLYLWPYSYSDDMILNFKVVHEIKCGTYVQMNSNVTAQHMAMGDMSMFEEAIKQVKTQVDELKKLDNQGA